MNKKIISIIIAIAIILVAVVTCPNKEAHQNALMDEMNSAMNEKLTENMGDSDLEQGLVLLGSSFASKIIETVIESTLKTNNYFVFSTGEISVTGKSKVVSTGFFGHVFTHFSADDIKEALKE